MTSTTAQTARPRPRAGGREATTRSARRSAREPLLVALAAIALAILWTWPFAAHLGQALPHDPRFSGPERGDVHASVWGIWWAAESLARGTSLFHTDAVFAPVGHGLHFHPHAALFGVVVAPIERVFGAVFAYGCAWLGLLATTAAATYALARTMGLAASPAALAAFAYAFSPYFLQAGLEALHLFANPLVPCAVLGAWTWRRGGERAIVGALTSGAFLGATLLVDAGIAAFTAVLVLLVLLLASPRTFDGAEKTPRPRFGARRALSPFALLAFVAGGAVAAAPWLLSFARASQDGTTVVEVVRDRDGQDGPRLFDFASPSGLHPLLRREGAPSLPAAGAADEIVRSEHAALQVSLVLLALAVVGALRTTQARRFVAVASLSFLVAWDPGGGIATFLRGATSIDVLRVPARMLPFALLPLALAAAMGYQRLVARGRTARVAALVLFGLLAAESLAVPYPLARFRPPEVVRAIGAEVETAAVGRDALLVLPLTPGPSVVLSWQTVHQRPMPFGPLGRVERRAYERFARLAPGLVRASLGGPLPHPESVRIELDLLGVTHVLLDTSMAPGADAWIDLLDDVRGFERRPEGEDERGGVGEDGVLGWSRRRAGGVSGV